MLCQCVLCREIAGGRPPPDLLMRLCDNATYPTGFEHAPYFDEHLFDIRHVVDDIGHVDEIEEVTIKGDVSVCPVLKVICSFF